MYVLRKAAGKIITGFVFHKRGGEIGTVLWRNILYHEVAGKIITGFVFHKRGGGKRPKHVEDNEMNE
jgi:hypothetical protein